MGIPRSKQIIVLTDYKRSLDIEKGIWQFSYKVGNEKREVEAFCSFKDNVIAYQAKGNNINCVISYTRKKNERGFASSYLDSLITTRNSIIAQVHNGSIKDGLCFCVRITVDGDAENINNHAGEIYVSGAKKLNILISIETTFRCTDPAFKTRQRIERAKQQPVSLIKKENSKRIKELMDRTILSLPSSNSAKHMYTEQRRRKCINGEDPGFYELLFNYGKYLMICSSYLDSLPANLQGIWNPKFTPAWGSRYTLNINTELNYSFVNTVRLEECLYPLLNHLKRMQKKGRIVAKTMYGLNGMVAHHNTDLWGDCAPEDRNRQATVWPLGAAWLSTFIWTDYLYSRNKSRLKKFYEILQDNVLFLSEYSYLDKKDYLRIGPAVSPENCFLIKQKSYSISDLAKVNEEITFDLFVSYLKASKILNINNSLTQKVTRLVSHIHPISFNKDGISEWEGNLPTLEPGHRHISQLYFLFPGINFDSEAQNSKIIDASQKTIDVRLSNGSGGTGWSRVLIALYLERLNRGKSAYKHLSLLIKNSMYPNLFDKHPPFQIDGNFGLVAAISGMFVQDFGNTIKIFPKNVLSQSGKLKNFRLKTGALLSLKWEDGSLRELKIENSVEKVYKVEVIGREKEDFYAKLKNDKPVGCFIFSKVYKEG